MAIVVDLIRQYAPWIYGACALIALWYLRVVILARRERRYSVFNLEKETALNKTFGAWGAAFGIVLAMGLVYFLSTYVSDVVRPLVEADLPTPTPSFASAAATAGPTPTLPVPEITPTAAPTQKPRPTARPQPTVAPEQALQEPPTPAVARPRCPDARAVITAPGVGAQVSGAVAIVGVAQHENFGFYKLEYGAGADPAVWSYFGGGEQPVAGGQLGVLSPLPPGTYSVRVVVVDSSGNFPPPCQTTITFR
jgi:hypothetical protein